MSDLIDRQMAIDNLGEEPEVWEDDDEYGMGQRSEWCHIKKIIEKLPTAQPERKKGKWEEVQFRTIPYNRISKAKKCSVCGKRKDKYVTWNYCPSCGADMRGKEKE